MSEEQAYRCGRYRPGHDVHWIQAKLARRCEPDPTTGEKSEPVPGHVLEVRPDGLVVIEAAGSIHRLWNHDPLRLERLALANAGLISYQPGFHLLRTVSEIAFETVTFGEPRTVLLDGSYLFCVARAEKVIALAGVTGHQDRDGTVGPCRALSASREDNAAETEGKQ